MQLQRGETFAVSAASPASCEASSSLPLSPASQPQATPSARHAEELGGWSSSDDLEDDGGGDHQNTHVVLDKLDAERGFAIDSDAIDSRYSSWIDLVSMDDVDASLDMNVAFESKHLHQARVISQSLMSHFGSDSREMLMAQRFRWTFFKNVMYRYSLSFTSDDADQEFGELMLAEATSKVSLQTNKLCHCLNLLQGFRCLRARLLSTECRGRTSKTRISATFRCTNSLFVA